MSANRFIPFLVFLLVFGIFRNFRLPSTLRRRYRRRTRTDATWFSVGFRTVRTRRRLYATCGRRSGATHRTRSFAIHATFFAATRTTTTTTFIAVPTVAATATIGGTYRERSHFRFTKWPPRSCLCLVFWRDRITIFCEIRFLGHRRQRYGRRNRRGPADDQLDGGAHLWQFTRIGVRFWLWLFVFLLLVLLFFGQKIQLEFFHLTENVVVTAVVDQQG